MTLRAYEQADTEFAGWYEDENRVSTDRNYTFTAEKERTITGKFITTLNEDHVSLEPGVRIYNGKAQQPDVSVTYGEEALKEGTDYTVSYSNDSSRGVTLVIITGQGNYTGAATKTFTANAANKANQRIQGVGRNITKTYGEKPFWLKAKAQGKLTYRSSDPRVVTVSPAGQVTIKGTGKAMVTITAAATANYNQARAQVMITVKPQKVAAVKVKAAKKKMMVSWKKDKKATGYQITYAQNKKFTKAKNM